MVRTAARSRSRPSPLIKTRHEQERQAAGLTCWPHDGLAAGSPVASATSPPARPRLCPRRISPGRRWGLAGWLRQSFRLLLTGAGLLSGQGEAGQCCGEAQDGREGGQGEEQEARASQCTRQPGCSGRWLLGCLGLPGPVVERLGGIHFVMPRHGPATYARRRGAAARGDCRRTGTSRVPVGRLLGRSKGFSGCGGSGGGVWAVAGVLWPSVGAGFRFVEAQFAAQGAPLGLGG